MNAENIRQRVWYYVQDNPISMSELADATGLDHQLVANFLYGGEFPNDSIAQTLNEYVSKQYAIRDEIHLSMKGMNAKDSED